MNFNEATKKKLKMESGYLCANPNCRAITIYYGGTLGQACHIIAASPNGPRNNKKRKDLDEENNGIWLCLKCAKQIDLHPEKYPVKLLEKWKNNTKQYIENNVNIPISYINNKINYYVMIVYIIDIFECIFYTIIFS